MTTEGQGHDWEQTGWEYDDKLLHLQEVRPLENKSRPGTRVPARSREPSLRSGDNQRRGIPQPADHGACEEEKSDASEYL